MFKSSIFILLFTFISFHLVSQSFWRSTTEKSIVLNQHQDRGLIPEQYSVYTLAFDELLSYIENAPMEVYGEVESDVKIDFPMPNGSSQSFNIFNSTAMEEGISNRYPGIRTFIGYAENGDNIIFDFTSFGFHGSIWTKKGMVYIDPYAKGNNKHYTIYYAKDHQEDELMSSVCGYDQDNVRLEEFKELTNNRTETVPLHTYRLALACTGEHGRRFNSVDEVLQNMNTAVNRLNLIFINELSIKVVIVDGNDKIINMNPQTDPYAIGNSGREILVVNTGILNQKIGSNKYDIGHVFTSSCTDVGGVAFLGSVCAGNKGGGVTCVGSVSNISFTAVRITAHEMGHQFGAAHTFNNCGGNESTGSAFEPGGGSTIMSYGGLCGSNSFVNTNDDYYHNYSLQQMFQYTRNSTGSICGTKTEIGNHAPVAIVDYEDDFFIPISTPFELTGDGTDEDEEDILSFVWEQMDRGMITPLGQPVGDSPLFRSIKPSEKKTRYFPNLEIVRFNSLLNSELLPTYTRNLKFRFVVRDNHVEGGLVDWKQLDFKATSDAGPFVVIHPSTYNLNFEVGDVLPVTWDVANTDGEKVNVQYVDIYYSSNDGRSFPKLLAKKVPNTGAFDVTIPNIESEKGRIKVKAHNNVFYDMSNRDFDVFKPDQGIYFELSELYQEICLPATSGVDINTTIFGDVNQSIVFDVVNSLPDGIVASFTSNIVEGNGTTSIELDMLNSTYSGFVEVLIRGVVEGVDTVYQTLILDVTSNDFSEFVLMQPLDNTTGADRLVTFVWDEVVDVDKYKLEIATNPSFDEIMYSKDDIQGGTFEMQDLLELNTVYYWRVVGSNKCGITNSDIFVFGTKSKFCKTYTANNLPKAISASGTPTVEAIFNVSSTAKVVDVNVKKISLLHDYVGNLTGYLRSPSGTEMILWSKKCANLGTINCAFDDETTLDIKCPMVNRTYQPKQSLSIFNNEDISGPWRLVVKDGEVGDGGEFKEAIIEICEDKVLNSPYLFNNTALGVKPNNENILNNNFLWVKDDDNTSEQLIFTVVTLPENGVLRYNNIPVIVGFQFTQKNINDSKISYRHDGGNTILDQFEYTVIDGNGGWIPKTVFEVNIGDEFPDQVIDNVLEDVFNVFPNPVTDILVIEQKDGITDRFDIEVREMNGQLINKKKGLVGESNKLDLKNLNSGMYILIISRGASQLYKKISVVK